MLIFRVFRAFRGSCLLLRFRFCGLDAKLHLLRVDGLACAAEAVDGRDGESQIGVHGKFGEGEDAFDGLVLTVWPEEELVRQDAFAGIDSNHVVHGAFRADGAAGQLTVVIPSEDAVVSVNAGLGNMQRELDLI